MWLFMKCVLGSNLEGEHSLAWSSLYRSFNFYNNMICHDIAVFCRYFEFICSVRILKNPKCKIYVFILRVDIGETIPYNK